MQITLGAGAASTIRYEVAWCMPQPEFGRAKGAGQISWWFDAAFASEQSARGRLKQIEGAVCANRGSVVIYEVAYDGKNRIVFDRVAAQSGDERPPSRSKVLAPAAPLKAAFAKLVSAPSRRQGSRPKNTIQKAVSLIVAAGFVAAMSAAVFFGGMTWWQAPVRDIVDNKMREADRLRKQQAPIIVMHGNSCEHYMFDNASGAVRAEATKPCGPEKLPKLDVDKMNAFANGWKGTPP